MIAPARCRRARRRPAAPASRAADRRRGSSPVRHAARGPARRRPRRLRVVRPAITSRRARRVVAAVKPGPYTLPRCHVPRACRSVPGSSPRHLCSAAGERLRRTADEGARSGAGRHRRPRAPPAPISSRPKSSAPPPTRSRRAHVAVSQRDYRQALSLALDAKERARDAARTSAERMAQHRSEAEQTIGSAAERWSRPSSDSPRPRRRACRGRAARGADGRLDVGRASPARSARSPREAGISAGKGGADAALTRIREDA